MMSVKRNQVYVSLLCVANIIIMMCLLSNSGALYEDGVDFAALLAIQFLVAVTFTYILCKSPYWSSTFPQETCISFAILKQYSLPAGFLSLTLWLGMFVFYDVGISRSECVASLTVAMAAGLSYIVLGDVPSICGGVCAFLAFASAITSLAGTSTKIWCLAFASNGANVARTVALKRIQHKVQPAAGLQMLHMCLASLVYLVAYGLGVCIKKNEFVYKGLLNDPTATGLGLFVLKREVYYCSVFSTVTNFLVILLNQMLSPVGYHVQSQFKSVLLSLYDILLGQWLILIPWIGGFLKPGTPDKLNRTFKYSMFLKGLAFIVYIIDKLVRNNEVQCKKIRLNSLESKISYEHDKVHIQGHIPYDTI